MPHEDALIATLAVSLALAFFFGLFAVRLRMPPLVGYLVAGVGLESAHPGLRSGCAPRAAAGRESA